MPLLPTPLPVICLWFSVLVCTVCWERFLPYACISLWNYKSVGTTALQPTQHTSRGVSLPCKLKDVIVDTIAAARLAQAAFWLQFFLPIWCPRFLLGCLPLESVASCGSMSVIVCLSCVCASFLNHMAWACRWPCVENKQSNEDSFEVLWSTTSSRVLGLRGR